MHKWTDYEIKLHIRAVILLLLSMVALAMVAKVSEQDWDSKVTAYPTKTEAAMEQYARDLIARMTLEEQVGQLFYGTNLPDVEAAAEQYALGGVLLNASDFANLTSADVTAVLTGYQAAASTPILIGVAEEGGNVNAVSVHPALRPKAFLSPAELMTTGGLKLVEGDARDKSDLLRGFGIHMNFAPVCDIVSEESAKLYARVPHGDADDAARYVGTVVKAMTERKMQPVLKYFPGYGDLQPKDRTDVLTDTRTLDQLRTEALLPFARGIDEGARFVMMGHIVVQAVDAERPASLSRSVHNLLRREMGFEGVIISGNLQTKGLQAYGTAEELAVQAILAGSDMLLTEDCETQIPAVVDAVRRGDISRERVEESLLRILKLKMECGILK